MKFFLLLLYEWLGFVGALSQVQIISLGITDFLFCNLKLLLCYLSTHNPIFCLVEHLILSYGTQVTSDFSFILIPFHMSSVFPTIITWVLFKVWTSIVEKSQREKLRCFVTLCGYIPRRVVFQNVQKLIWPSLDSNCGLPGCCESTLSIRPQRPPTKCVSLKCLWF